MDEKRDILDAWIMVEHLSEGNINKKDKQIKEFIDFENEDFYDLFSKEIEKKKFTKKQNGGIVVYFDIFNFEEVVSILHKKYHLEPTNEDIRFGHKFSFAICFDKELNLCPDMTFFTASAYIRWYKEMPAKGTFTDFELDFKTRVSKLFCIEENRQNAFNYAMRKLLRMYDTDVQNCRMQVVNNIETDSTNLHSFFIEDLQKAKGIRTVNLDDYMSGKISNRINLDSKIDSPKFNPDTFKEILQPKNYPISRFPCSTEFALYLMQQMAVNLSIGYDNKQIRSVNGPPGTGKTTLLKDIFAELVVEQAYDIARLPQKVIKGNANTVYYGKGTIGEMPTYISEKGIVVASSNNSAVQNIVNELPLIKEIDKDLIDELRTVDYFAEISNSKVATKWITDENNKGKPLQVIEKNLGDDKFWGLFSLEGGKSDNMTNIITYLKCIAEYLESEYISNDKIYEEFIEQYKSVDNIRKHLQIYVENSEKYKKTCKQLEELKKSYIKEKKYKEANLRESDESCKELEDKTRANIEEFEKYQRDIAEKKATNERNRNSLELCILSLRDEKPWFFARRKVKLAYKTKLEEINHQLSKCVIESQKITEEERRGEFKLQELKKKIDELRCKRQKVQSEFKNWDENQQKEILKLEEQCDNYKKTLEGKKLKELDMSSGYEQVQLSNPWFDETYRIAQSKLFIMALKVRKQFLYENVKNIKASIIIWDKQNDYLDKKHIIVAAWNWINMAIPVISSTFASFSRMCKNMDAETLGHLFIDEAGQALPQASVGAIYRSKHVMVVGDPSQIKPVLTLDTNVLRMLGKHFGVSEMYLSNTVSTQTLVDRISQYGFYKGQDEWIGIPLWVHRRCRYPMFTISNKISYKDFMVQGKPENGKAEWYDIRGNAEDKYVKEQGDFLANMIEELAKENPKIKQRDEKDVIYVITPFSHVAYCLAERLRKIGFTRYDEHGKPTNVGTIHTFQGKEASIVFLVLGADNTSKGAAKWAVEEPNMMNVAATRAKEEFYVIGDKSLYLNLGCDVAADTYKIIEQYKKQYPELVES